MTSRKTTTSAPHDALTDKLCDIGLRGLAAELDDVIARATRGRWSVTKLLEHIVTLETQDRARRSMERRLGRSRLGRFKPMADFDWTWPKKLDKDALERVLSLDFLDHHENVVLIANQGLGKTMIAKNLAHEAIVAGRTALFISASDLLLDLGKQETGRTLERRIKYFCTPHLLVIDELGYLSYDNQAADLIFQIVTRRYERRPTVLTTNLAFSEWPTVFPNATCAVALIDRLTHHAEIITMEGESYRMREAGETKKRRRKSGGRKPRRRGPRS
ncbi:MAG: IS21-like element helper ATPase IstB [Bacteroidota bacterium]